ncbi:MAG TPA: hypothetical protein VLL54_20215 [Pyrinomonadaceae bacterium]|nr:hypothetical protein [Pyrinomonadaceae bacterium]
MKYVRFMVVDGSDLSLINNLAHNLTTTQSEFQFLVHDKPLVFPRSAAAARDGLDKLEGIALKLAKKEYPDEFPVVVCNSKFKGYKFARNSVDVSIIITSGLPPNTTPGFLDKYIAYVLVDALMGLRVSILGHRPSRKCAGDIWEKVEEVAEGLAQGDYCTACLKKIRNAVGRDITVHELAALFRILDYTANRKVCFVMMPFSKAFTAIYKNCLRPTLKGQQWECRRADEIFQSTAVMDLVREEILRADLIVADLTGKNPNVFYELGYAHAVDKTTILITQSIEDVPFDLRHRQLIEYQRTPRGLKRLAENIVKYV